MKKKLRTTGNGEERRKKRIVSWRLGGPSSSSVRSLLSLILSLSFCSSPPRISLFCFHEGEEPVCIRGVERKNRKSEEKSVRDLETGSLAVAQKAHLPTQALKNEEEPKTLLYRISRSRATISVYVQIRARATKCTRIFAYRSRSCERAPEENHAPLLVISRRFRSRSRELHPSQFLETSAPRSASSPDAPRKGCSRQGL